MSNPRLQDVLDKVFGPAAPPPPVVPTAIPVRYVQRETRCRCREEEVPPPVAVACVLCQYCKGTGYVVTMEPEYT